ncbi:MAG: rhodanese-like domain-containing protein [Pyrinomonadaceae bacterium]|jgi:predicted sulfurtransferase|nr:rhodanese-like domain-containing protein [Pyrinomonadaceae bacterium]
MRLILSLLLVSVLAIGLACQNTAGETANKTTSNEIKKTTSTPADSTARITLAEAKKDFDAGNAVFIDTRVEYQFKQERIKGAINIPTEAIETKFKEIPTGKKIIAYCS